MKRLMFATVIAVTTVMVLAACDAEDAELTLEGPDSVKQNDLAWFDATVTGATPILGFVGWWTFVDLDDDNFPDRNEVIEISYSGVDRMGMAHKEFWLHPKSYFGDRKLSVPTSAEVKVRAEVSWSDPTARTFILVEDHTLRISRSD